LSLGPELAGQVGHGSELLRSDLARAEPDHLNALRRQVLVALSVPSSCSGVAVGGAVGLDHEVVLGPVEVEQVGAEAVVDQRLWEAGLSDQLEELAFQV
jgi:hypothetical protein